MKPIIQADELVLLVNQPNLVLADVRTGPGAREKYQSQHLDKALFVDMDKDLAEIGDDASHGGRHPLPPADKFADLLGLLGIDRDSHVIVYDDKNGANAAARFWWMLIAAGHDNVQVLDGGIQAAVSAGYPTSSKIEVPSKVAPYYFKAWRLPTVSIEQVEQFAGDPNYMVIDVRDAERYRGEKEPIDLVAGHIPNAVNIPFTTNLDSNGNFLPPGQLKSIYNEVVGDRDSSQVIVHCGSGVTACHTLLAIAHAGMKIPNLYVGSWSEWSRTGRPIATNGNAEK